MLLSSYLLLTQHHINMLLRHYNSSYSIRAAEGSGGEQNSRAAQQSSQGILRFYTDDAPGFQM